MRAVLPVSVNTAMAPMGRSSAACAIDSQIVSATESAWRSRRRRGSLNYRHVALGFDHDPAIMATASRGYLSAGGFAGEHDGVGAVENGVGNVTGLGARGARVFDHRLEHLGGDDHRLAPFRGAADHVLLNDGNFLGRHLDPRSPRATMTPSAASKNFFQMLDRLRLFELGDHGHIASVRRRSTA